MADFGIGVISSITCEQSFKDAFENAANGVATGGLSFSYFDQVGYDPTLLTQAVKNFDVDKKVDLIVTFGGCLAYNAANTSSATTDFISLLGVIPGTGSVNGPSAQNLGGVSLQSYAYNQPQSVSVVCAAGIANITDPTNSFKNGDNVAFTAGTLPTGIAIDTIYKVANVAANTFQIQTGGVVVTPTTAGNNVLAWSDKNRVAQIQARLDVESKQISLLYHSSSPLTHDEITAWQGSWPAIKKLFGAGPGGPAVPITVRKSLAQAFESITTKAVIVSADPYFQDNKEALIRAANESDRLICYPLHNYRNKIGANKPANNRSIVYGARLEAAITLMGHKAGAIANSPGAAQGFSIAPSSLFAP